MNNWKNTIVSPETKIRKVIEVIESSKLKISFIVDANNILIGNINILIPYSRINKVCFIVQKMIGKFKNA